LEKPNPQPVCKIPCQPQGRPPIRLEIDVKLIKLLKDFQAKGLVVNIHVVRATATALIESNPSSLPHHAKFKMPRSWVQSVYQRMGYSQQIDTTAHPPVPNGLYQEFEGEYLADINNKRVKYNIPPELVINVDQTPSSYVSVGRKNGSAF